MINKNINSFTYNGKCSKEFDIVITQPPEFTVSARDITFTSVPGRNGDVITDNGRYCNVPRIYKVALFPSRNTSIVDTVKLIKAWLREDVNYHTLFDTYDSAYFYKAVCFEQIDIATMLLQISTAEIKFNCEPFRYSWNGLKPIEFTPIGGTIINPELYESLPLIEIEGNGDITLMINNNSYQLKNVYGGLSIDSENQIAYYNNILQNSKCNFKYFPVLQSGANSISVIGNASNIKITPNWRSL